MKQRVGDHKFKSYDNVGTAVKQWLKEKDIRFLWAGVSKKLNTVWQESQYSQGLCRKVVCELYNGHG